MKLLLVNDDGVYASGIQVLAGVLAKNHEVLVMAPNGERSGASHSVTFQTPLMVKKVELPQMPASVPVYAVNGSPADCVKLGLGNFIPDADAVISGINLGGNMGVDVLYSGTVGAAAEASALGRTAIAVSMDSYRPKHLESAAHAAECALYYLLNHPMPEHVFNINVPDLPEGEIRGVRMVRLGKPEPSKPYEKRVDPFGRDYYWMPGDFMSHRLADEGCDQLFLNEGYIVLTPVLVERTDFALMNQTDKAELSRYFGFEH